MKEYRRRYREKHGLPPEKERPAWKKRAAVIVALCVIGFGGFFAAQSKAEQMVTLNGQSIADMTSDDITNYLDLHEKDVEDKKLRLATDGVDVTLDLDELGAKLDRAYIDDELHLVGRRGLPWQRVADVVTTLRHGKDVPLAIAVDDDKLDKVLSDVHDKYDKDPQNAYAYVKDDQKTVAIEDAKDRIVINTGKLKEAVTDELHTGKTDTLDVPVDSREGADIKADDLKDIDTVLSYYTTHFDDTNPDRNVNIRLAQQRLNHAVVMAQKDFSFNKYVGTRTADKGYKPAPSYFENKLEQSTGGGVCQVSTTLFNAALRAGLFIASREPHFAPAAYVPVGMDATVADDGLDFSFTNPFQHPVCVYTVAGKNTVTTYILGNHADTCSVSFETTHLQNLPHKVIKKHDDSVTEDKRKQEGYDGHDVTIRRTVAYSDGDRHVDTIESHYDPNDEIILTPGDDSEEVVSTADLEPQDPLLNAPHDMMDFNVPAADTADTADEE